MQCIMWVQFRKKPKLELIHYFIKKYDYFRVLLFIILFIIIRKIVIKVLAKKIIKKIDKDLNSVIFKLVEKQAKSIPPLMF